MNDRTEDLQQILDRLVRGDSGAKNELIERAQERLRRLARKMLGSEPRIRRWEETDDLLNTALMKLNRALDETTPQNVRGFIGLAAQHMRWELVNMARHHFGPEGQARHHESDDAPGKDRGEALRNKEAEEVGPSTLAEWAAFHEKLDELPPEEREVFDILYYEELSQEDAAGLLKVSTRQVQRRWRSAKLSLARLLRVQVPKL